MKNLLVAAAPFAAAVMDDLATIATVALGIAAFSVVSSGMYAINDAVDVDVDRNHPKKQARPVAAGKIVPRTAVLFGVILVFVGIGLGLATGSLGFVAIIATYVGMAVAYSLWLKRVALVDIAMIAFGFLLRALSGAVLVDVPISEWFLIVTMFGALYIAAGKRFGERLELDDGGRNHRAALADYVPGFIEFLLGVSAAATLISYSLWAFAIQDGADGMPWAVLSLGPFVLGILRYAQLIYLGRGTEPEELVFKDRGLQATGVTWIVMVAAAFYGGST